MLRLAAITFIYPQKRNREGNVAPGRYDRRISIERERKFRKNIKFDRLCANPDTIPMQMHGYTYRSGGT